MHFPFLKGLQHSSSSGLQCSAIAVLLLLTVAFAPDVEFESASAPDSEVLLEPEPEPDVLFESVSVVVLATLVELAPDPESESAPLLEPLPDVELESEFDTEVEFAFT